MSHRPFKDRLYAEFATIGKALASAHRLELLDLTNNRLTARGVGALRRAGVNVLAGRQQKPPTDGGTMPSTAAQRLTGRG